MFGLRNFLYLDPQPRSDGTSALWEIGKDLYALGLRVLFAANEESTDSATQTVNGCSREHFDGLGFDAFADKLCGVVGDLHDNVWSHGKSTGFSMAQKWKMPCSTHETRGLESKNS